MMTPDSTQSDTKGSTKTTVSKRKSPSSSGGDNKASHVSKQAEAKKKPKVKKKSKKSSTPHSEDRQRQENDEDAEWMDLSLDLQPIGAYIKNRDLMLDEMLKTIKGEKLRSMLPEVMKKCTLEELRTLCLDQLEVMSKKRIQHILAGEEMTSSSDTDDTTDEDDTRCSKREASSSMLESSAVVDSTCTPTENQEDVDPAGAGELSGVTAKSSGENTPALSLSPDHGELDNLFGENKQERGCVTVEKTMVRDDNATNENQQHSSSTNEASDGLELKVPPDTDGTDHESTENIQDDIDRTVSNIIGGDIVDQPKPPGPQVSTEGGDDEVAVPTKTQMEILELELRARAIKALMKQQEQRERADPGSTS